MEENTNNGTTINKPENEVFVPRFKDSTGTTANRRKIKILQQVGDEMIVEITNETTPNEKGTALTAQMMNEFDKRVFDAEKNSTSAKSMAESAEQKAADALQHASENKGTMIYAGGELKQTFNMDEKADKQTTNQALENLSNGKADKEVTNQAIENLSNTKADKDEINQTFDNLNGKVSTLERDSIFKKNADKENLYELKNGVTIGDITVSGKIILE